MKKKYKKRIKKALIAIVEDQDHFTDDRINAAKVLVTMLDGQKQKNVMDETQFVNLVKTSERL